MHQFTIKGLRKKYVRRAAFGRNEMPFGNTWHEHSCGPAQVTKDEAWLKDHDQDPGIEIILC